MRLEPHSTMYGDSPYTLQTGECGEHGEYIQVTHIIFIIYSGPYK